MKLLSIIFVLFFSLSLSAQNTFQLSEFTVHFQTSRNGNYFVSINLSLLKATQHVNSKNGTTDVYSTDDKEFKVIYLNSCGQCPPSYFVYYGGKGEVIRMWELDDLAEKDVFTYTEIVDVQEIGKTLCKYK